MVLRAALLLLFATPASGEAPPLPTVKEVMARLDDMFRSTSSHGRMRMEVSTELYQRELLLESWTKGDDDALIVVREPAREAGTATLKTKEGLWSYAARADRLVRIPSALLSEDWLGSHLTNEDLVRETDYEDDYDSTLAWTEEGGRRLLEALMVPKPDAPVVYSKIRFLLEPESYVPVRGEYFDEEELVRTMRFEKVQLVSGRPVPLLLTVTPTDKPSEYTRLEHFDLVFGVDVPASLFTPRGLRKAATR